MGLARAELPSSFFGPCASQSARAATENRAQNGQTLGSTHLTLPSTPRPTTLGKGQGTTGEKSICLGWIPQGFARACLVKYGLLCAFSFCSSPSLSSLLPSSSPSPPSSSPIDSRFGNINRRCSHPHCVYQLFSYYNYSHHSYYYSYTVNFFFFFF